MRACITTFNLIAANYYKYYNCNNYRHYLCAGNGQVVEFTRTCEVETSSRIDQCFITSSSSECQKFCKTDLCNTGDGKVGGGSIALTPTGRLVALLAVVGTLLADWCK